MTRGRVRLLGSEGLLMMTRVCRAVGVVGAVIAALLAGACSSNDSQPTCTLNGKPVSCDMLSGPDAGPGPPPPIDGGGDKPDTGGGVCGKQQGGLFTAPPPCSDV